MHVDFCRQSIFRRGREPQYLVINHAHCIGALPKPPPSLATRSQECQVTCQKTSTVWQLNLHIQRDSSEVSDCQHGVRTGAFVCQTVETWSRGGDHSPGDWIRCRWFILALSRVIIDRRAGREDRPLPRCVLYHVKITTKQRYVI